MNRAQSLSAILRAAWRRLLPPRSRYRPGRDRLAAPDGPELARLAQEQSPVLPVLRKRLESLLQHRRCCIIGSAPGGTLPAKRPGDRFICVNGSVHAAGTLGIPQPDLTAITGYATHPKLVNLMGSLTAWHARKTTELVFVANGDSERHARDLFAQAGFGFDHFTSLTPWERAAIIRDATGLDLGLGPRDKRISMGSFAVTLAIWGGAAEVVLCGMSLHGGHSHLPGQTPRHHVPGDTRFFNHLLTLPLRSSSTSPEFQQIFGIPPPG